MNYRCGNCFDNFIITIDYGDSAFPNAECPNCGAKDSKPMGRHKPEKHF